MARNGGINAFIHILTLLGVALGITGIVIASVLIARPEIVATNVGSTGIGLFKDKENANFKFHKVAPSDAITTTLESDSVVLDLSDTGVIPGLYASPTMIVDIQGRVLNLTNGTTGEIVQAGSNIIVTLIPGGVSIATTDAISVTNFAVSGATVLGSNTTCTMPLMPSCYDISGQSCTSPLLSNCISPDLILNNLLVHNLTLINATTLNVPIGNQTAIYTDYLFVNNTIQSGPFTCSGSGSISNACLALGGYNCPLGLPLADSCIPASLPFYDVAVTNQLSVNQVVCLGGPLNTSCITPLGGDVTGSLGSNVISKIQGTALSAAAPSSGNVLTYNGTYWIALAPSGGGSLAGDVTGAIGSNTISKLQNVSVAATTPVSRDVLLFNGSYWIPSPSTNLNVPSTLVSRDSNGNSSFSVVSTNSIQSNSPTSQCMGLGPTTVINNPIIYVAKANPQFSLPTLFTFNTNTGSVTTIGTLAVFLYKGFAMAPSGILYGVADPNTLYSFNPATAATLSTNTFTPPINVYGLAFHSNGDLYMLDKNVQSVMKYNFTDNTVSTFAASAYPVGNYPRLTIIGDWIYIFLNQPVNKIYIPNPTINYVFGNYYTSLAFYEPVWPFAFCNGGAIHLGLGIQHSSTSNDITFLNKDNANAYDLFPLPTSLSNGNGVLQGTTSYCFQTTTVPTSCSTGSIDMAYNAINRTEAIYVDNIFGNTLYPTSTRVITIQNNANFASSTATLGFNNDTFLSRSSAGILSTTLITAKHFIPTNAAIPTAAAGTGAGTGPTITVTAASTDCKMQITVLTGSSPTASGTIITVTYNSAFTGTVVKGVLFSFANGNAAALSGTTQVFISSETLTTFVFTAGSAALAATTTYIWNFQACT